MSAHVRHYLQLLTSQSVRVPLGIATVALLAAVAGPEGMGRWALVLASTSILNAVFLNWTQGAYIRFGREEWISTGTLRRSWSGRWPWILGGLVLSTIVLILLPATPAGRLLGIPASWRPLLVGQLIGAWLGSEAQSLLQVKGRFDRLAIVPVVAAALTTIFLAVLYGLSPHAVVVALAGMVAVPAVVWGVTWWREFRGTGVGLVRPDRAVLLETARYGWPAVPAFLVGYASDWGDHLLLQAWFSAREVGLFQSAYQAMSASIALAAPMTTLLLPRLIDTHAADPESTRSFVTRVFPTVATLWAIGILPVLALLPSLYSLLMGARFADGEPMLNLLLVAVPGAVVLQLYTVLFSVQGRLGRAALYVAVMAGADLLLTLLLLPILGPRAAAAGTAASYVISQSLYIADQHRHLRVSAARILPVFVCMVTVAAAQAAVGGAPGPRVAVTLAGLAVLVWIVRRERIVEDEVVRTVLSGPLRRAGEYSVRVLGAAGGH